jgi:D-alanyl-D-alanine carboxypeptidase
MPTSTLPGSLSPDVALTVRNSLPELRHAEQGLRAQAAREGIQYDIAPFGSPLRTQADTTTILRYRANDYAVYVAKQRAAGKPVVDIGTFRPIAPFGSSYHDYGAAFDIHIAAWPDSMTASQALTHVGAMAPTYNLRWGASFGDTPHFELATTLSAVKAMWAAYNAPPLPDTSSLPGPSIIAPGVVPVTLPRVAAVAARLPAAVRAAAARHPLVTAGVSGGALIVAGLLVYLAVQRFLD